MLASEEFQNEAVGSLAKACITVRSYNCVFPQLGKSEITFIAEKVLLGSRTASVELVWLAPALQLSTIFKVHAFLIEHDM